MLQCNADLLNKRLSIAHINILRMLRESDVLVLEWSIELLREVDCK